MKAFILSVIFSVALAVVAGVVLDNFLSRQADTTFASSGVRVGEGGSIEARNFSGQGHVPAR